jgi:hypothetical protein
VIFNLTSLCNIAIRVEAYKARMSHAVLQQCQLFGHGNLPVLCGVGAVTSGGMPGKGLYTIDTDMLQLEFGGRRGTSSLQL